MLLRFNAHELDDHANPVPRTEDRSLEDCVHAEEVSHVPERPIGSLECTHGLPGNDAEGTDSRELGGDHLGHAIGEVLILGPPGEILQR